MERWLAALVASACILAPSFARADAGELAFGAGYNYVTPKEHRVLARASYGLSDFFAARVDLGAGFTPDFTRGLASAGLVYAYDVVSWVPEIGVYGGLSFADGDAYGRAAALAGIRRYFSRTISASLSAGAEYDGAKVGGDYVHAVVDLTLWFH